MSMKSVEIQIALPRTHDAGKLQEQLQQRGQLQNDLASQQAKKEEKITESGIFRGERKDIARFQQHKGAGKNREQEKKDGRKKNVKQIKHPFKGTMLDIRG